MLEEVGYVKFTLAISGFYFNSHSLQMTPSLNKKRPKEVCRSIATGGISNKYSANITKS